MKIGIFCIFWTHFLEVVCNLFAIKSSRLSWCWWVWWPDYLINVVSRVRFNYCTWLFCIQYSVWFSVIKLRISAFYFSKTCVKLFVISNSWVSDSRNPSIQINKHVIARVYACTLVKTLTRWSNITMQPELIPFLLLMFSEIPIENKKPKIQ